MDVLSHLFSTSSKRYFVMQANRATSVLGFSHQDCNLHSRHAHFCGYPFIFVKIGRLKESSLRYVCINPMMHIHVCTLLYIPGPPNAYRFFACACKLPQRSTLLLKSEYAYMFKRRLPLWVLRVCTFWSATQKCSTAFFVGRCLGVQVLLYVLTVVWVRAKLGGM